MIVEHCWLAVIGDVAARDLDRSGWHQLRGAWEAVPATGDRIAVLRTHRPDFAKGARFIGTADIHRASDGTVTLRHRITAPTGHEPSAAEILHLGVSLAWTDERVAALLGTVVRIDADDFDRIERVLRERALAFGPDPSRPHHRRPRTPGRRAILSARVMNRSLRSFR